MKTKTKCLCKGANKSCRCSNERLSLSTAIYRGVFVSYYFVDINPINKDRHVWGIVKIEDSRHAFAVKDIYTNDYLFVEEFPSEIKQTTLYDEITKSILLNGKDISHKDILCFSFF